MKVGGAEKRSLCGGRATFAHCTNEMEIGSADQTLRVRQRPKRPFLGRENGGAGPRLRVRLTD